MATIKADQLSSFRQDLRLFTRWIDKINKLSCHLDINVAQCHVIMELGDRPSITVNELARQMRLDKSTISRQVENIVSSKIATRIPGKKDRRKVEISLDQKGLNLYKRINKEMDQNFASAFEGISNEDIKVFLRVFHQLSQTESKNITNEQ